MTSWLQVGFIAIGGAPVGMLGLAAAAGGAPAIRTAWHALLVGCFVLAVGLVVGIAAAGLSPVTSLAAFAAGVAAGVAGGGAAFVLGRFGQAGRRLVAHAVRQRVRAAMAPAPPRHLNRRLILAVVAAAVALAMATGAAFAAGLLTNRPISEVPVAIWQQHFQQEHHGTTGKGSLGPGEAGTLAAAQQRAGFQARTLKGIPGAKLNRVTSNTVTFRDGSREPTIELEYELGDVKVIATEIKDPHPDAPFEVPSLSPNMRIERIDDSQYLVIADETGKVRDMQFKTSDGIVFSVNFFGPPYPNAVGPGGVDVEFARNVIRHLS